jgi:hypothetical protein
MVSGHLQLVSLKTLPSGAKEAAEKLIEWSSSPEKLLPQGLKPASFEPFTARMNPCPFKTAVAMEFFRSL